MKKTLLFIAILFFSSLASAGFLQMQEQIIMSKHAVACTKDTGTLVMDQDTIDQAVGLAVGDALGQSISYASDWTLYSISIRFNSSCSSCVVSVRIGTSDNLGTYMEKWDNVSISDAGELKEFISLDTDIFTGTTTYYIGAMEMSGTCEWNYAETDVYAGGTRWSADSGWEMGSSTGTNDMTMEVYKTEITPCE